MVLRKFGKLALVNYTLESSHVRTFGIMLVGPSAGGYLFSTNFAIIQLKNTSYNNISYRHHMILYLCIVYPT